MGDRDRFLAVVDGGEVFQPAGHEVVLVGHVDGSMRELYFSDLAEGDRCWIRSSYADGGWRLATVRGQA